MRGSKARDGMRAASLLALATGLCASVALAGPRAKVSSPEIDLGSRRSGEVVETRFEISNVGDAVLRLENVRPGCSCTVVSFPPEVAPGDTATIETTLDTKGLRGPNMRNLTAYTNDPDRRRIPLRLKVHIPTAVDLLPHPKLHMSTAREDARRARLLVRQREEAAGALRVHDLRASVPWIRVSAERLNAARPASPGFPEGLPGDWLITADLTGDAPFGRSEQVLTFATDLPAEPEVAVSAPSNVVRTLTADADRVVLAVSEPDVAPEGVVSLRTDIANANRIRVESVRGPLRVALRPWGRSEALAIVTWEGGERIEGSVTFALDDHRVTVQAEGSPGS